MNRIVLLATLLLLAATALPRRCFAETPLPRLHAQGTDIVDASGHPVTLTGINLGGWLVEEMWMQPFVTTPPAGSAFKPIKDHVTLWGTVRQRFGASGETRIQAAFRNAWLSEADFAHMQATGMNCVRLPFLASLADEPDGLHWLDQAIGWAGRHQIYVILDLHGAPGSQNKDQTTGEAGVNAFFSNPDDIAKTEALWTLLARRYRDNPTVAGYDTLNEPMGTPNSDTLYVVQDRLYRAIRASDPSHLIFIEDGYTGVEWMPFPVPAGWTDVVYSTHYYDFGAPSEAEQQSALDGYVAKVEREQSRRQEPFYVGEYSLEPKGTPAMLTAFLQTLQAKHISSSVWTYKVSKAAGWQSMWGLYSNVRPITPLDPYRDTEAEWNRKCAQLRTDQLDVNSGMEEAIQKATHL